MPIANKMLNLGQRIKSRRVLMWMSQEELGQRVGVSRRQVAYWESNADAPSALSLVRICEMLQVSTDWLLNGSGWLRDIHDPALYTGRKQRYVERTRTAKIRLFQKLPFDLETKRTLTVDVLAEDRDAIAFTVPPGFSSAYAAGDLLLLHPVNLTLEIGEFTDAVARKLTALHHKHAAVILNGNGLLADLHFDGAQKLQFQPLQNRRGRAAHIHTVKPRDQVVIQAAVYKCIRTF